MLKTIKLHFLEMLAFAFVVLFLLWATGYVCNAVYETKFDLASCWGGFQALGGAGFLATIKYIIDSKFNSTVGQNPYTSVLPNNFNLSVSAGVNKGNPIEASDVK